MKKSLIVVAAFLAAGGAYAQSAYNLYGIADLYVGKAGKASPAVGSGGVSTSRFGLKGTTDLGGGLKGTFNLESGINLVDGKLTGSNDQIFGRQANVGLEGAFGTVKFGRSFNAADDVFGASNSGFDSALSANGVWLKGITAATDAQLYYATPVYSGFSAAVSTQLKGNTAAGSKRISALNAKYANGPVAAAYAYESNETGQKGNMFNGSYDLGAVKLLGSYFTTKTGVVGGKSTSYQLGADVPLGVVTVSVGYAASKLNIKGNGYDTGFGVAAAYSLHKNTIVYGGVRQTTVKAANGSTDKDLVAIGIRHEF